LRQKQQKECQQHHDINTRESRTRLDQQQSGNTSNIRELSNSRNTNNIGDSNNSRNASKSRNASNQLKQEPQQQQGCQKQQVHKQQKDSRAVNGSKKICSSRVNSHSTKAAGMLATPMTPATTRMPAAHEFLLIHLTSKKFSEVNHF
jgi:hypothetical protein